MKLESCGQRLDFLRRKLWAGDQQAMAHDLDVSQATISRVTRDERSLPLKLLQAMARSTQINLHWLLIGTGEPLRTHDHAECGPVLPVVDHPLPGPPDEHFLEVKGVYPATRTQFAVSRYWLEVTDSLVKKFKLTEVLAGDWLLIDTDLTDLSDQSPMYVVMPTDTSMPKIQEESPLSQKKQGSTRNLRNVTIRDSHRVPKGKRVSSMNRSAEDLVPEVVGIAVMLQRNFETL